MTIDSQARLQAQYLLRCIATTRATFFDIEYDWPVSRDLAIAGIQQWLWMICEDQENRPVYDLLDEFNRQILQNCLVFLTTNKPFPTRRLSPWRYLQQKLKRGWDWQVRCTLPDYPEWPFPDGCPINTA